MLNIFCDERTKVYHTSACSFLIQFSNRSLYHLTQSDWNWLVRHVHTHVTYKARIPVTQILWCHSSPQNSHPLDYHRVQCYWLHLNFTFLTCHVLTLITLYMQITQLISVLASWYYLLQTQSSCTNLTQILHQMEAPLKCTLKHKQFCFPRATLVSQALFKLITP